MSRCRSTAWEWTSSSNGGTACGEEAGTDGQWRKSKGQHQFTSDAEISEANRQGDAPNLFDTLPFGTRSKSFTKKEPATRGHFQRKLRFRGSGGLASEHFWSSFSWPTS